MMESTPTDRQKRPEWCKFYGYLALCQARTPWLQHTCIMQLGRQCPDYTPKNIIDEKD